MIYFIQDFQKKIYTAIRTSRKKDLLLAILTIFGREFKLVQL